MTTQAMNVLAYDDYTIETSLNNDDLLAFKAAIDKRILHHVESNAWYGLDMIVALTPMWTKNCWKDAIDASQGTIKMVEQ